MADYCWFNADGAENSPYYQYVFFLSFVISLQLMLLVHTIVHYKNLLKIRKYSVFYVLLQLSGLSWTINDIFKHVILVKFVPGFIFNSILCNFTAYYDKVIPLMFYVLCLVQLLFRLSATFKGSQFETSQRLNICLWSYLIIPFVIFNITWLSFLEPMCWRSWIPSDIPNKHIMYYCHVSIHHSPLITNISIYLIVFWYLAANLTFGLLFTCKLKKLLSNSSGMEEHGIRDIAIRNVMVKNTILTVTLTGSTFISLLSSALIGDSLVYFDLFLNCLCLGLMFKHNDTLYSKLFCRLCSYWFNKKTKGLELMAMSSNSLSDTTTRSSKKSHKNEQTATV